MKEAIRLQILNGNLQMPNMPELRKCTAPATYHEIEKLFSAMWTAYLRKGINTPISLPYWAVRINNPKAMNIAISTLSKAGWITSKALPNNNWAEAYINESKLLSYVTKSQLDDVRSYNKFRKYQLGYEVPSTDASLVNVQGNLLRTGITAPGFTKEGNVPFSLDTKAMYRWKDETIKLVNKGISKTIAQYPELVNDHANYAEIATEIVENYINEAGTYTSGPRTSDPRGRNNAGYLNKVGNPVGYKIMRSMLVIPEQYRNKATEQSLANIYLFIAELHGFKNGTVEAKQQYGEACYKAYDYIDLDVDDSEDDLDKLYENVWLERLYDDLDAYFESPSTHYWSVPIEIDMTASVLGYIGLLLNHKPFMERCNMIGSILTDAWAHPIITNRVQFKTIMRQCYGSMLTPGEMWREMEIPYTRDEELAFAKELQSGELAIANAFKNFIIGNVEPEPIMHTTVRNRTIKTFCNRFHNVGECTTMFDLYDTYSNSIRRVSHTNTVKVPNLHAFRRYFVTLLIHGLDGNVMDSVMNALLPDNWALSIHDAILTCPETVTTARNLYANELTDIHANRNEILSNYFRSIGIKASAMTEWKALVAKLVVPFEGTFKCSPMVLK